MSDHTQAAGHAGCLAYARLAILLVFIANALAYCTVPNLAAMLGMLLAAGAAGGAYVSQMLFNHWDIEQDEDTFRRGQIAQVISLVVAVLSALTALVAA